MFEPSPKQRDLIRAPFNRTLDWLEGTPRSGKTTAGTFRFARHLIKSRDNIHLVTAYSAEQAYRLIMDGDGFGLLHIFKGLCRTSHDDSGAHLLINLPNREPMKVYWKGGGKADSHKAITGMSLGSVYFCEINLLHDSMIQECFRRTYAARDRWHIADLNPPSPADPCIKNVLNVQDCRFVHWTCADNPILTPERLREIETACRKSPFLYKRDWRGERVIPEGVIYWMFSPEKHILSKVPDDFTICEAFVAGDGGTTNATSIGFYLAGFFGDRYFGERTYKLYRVGNWYYDRGQMAMSDQAKAICGEFLPYMRRKYRVRESGVYIDPACKALRLEIEKYGIMTNGADNNAHDVKGATKGLKVGVEMLQSGFNDGHIFLVEDERFGTEPFVKEAGLYCVNTDGNPVDAYNHAMDEVRYAYSHFAKTYGLWG
ncbi:MAG: PBSX family phage terminase large subunit [Exiguobacterium sp.]|nr:PBSX family phage terminase large subunit [Exiguobacterium sp.]